MSARNLVWSVGKGILIETPDGSTVWSEEYRRTRKQNPPAASIALTFVSHEAFVTWAGEHGLEIPTDVILRAVFPSGPAGSATINDVGNMCLPRWD